MPQLLVAIDIVFVELVFGQIECLAQLDCNLLLLQKDEFVVLHVLFRVCFQVGSQLVQIKAVFVVALLIVEEELTEFGGAERGPYHAVIQHILVH